MTKILVAFDGSAPARAAIDDLARAGLPDNTQATLLAVGETWFPPPMSYGLVDTVVVAHGVLVQEGCDVARAGKKALEDRFPGWTVRAESRAGSPVREILDCAREEKPDLLVVGSHGRTGIANFFLGSVAQNLAANAHCSVRIGRQSRSQTGPLHIVLAVDGSIGADAAAVEVADRRWPADTHVRVVTAIGPTALDGSGVRDEIARAREVQARAIVSLRAAGLETSSTILAADPRQKVVEEAASWPADCVFIGATGFVSLERAIFGTVVSAVTARAPCSVEVIRFRV